MLRGFLLTVCLVATPGGAAAQAARTDDPIRDLLSEVRLLRQAVERAATVGTRIQLLVARVQLQEQRISDLSRRLDTVRAEAREIDRGLAPMTEQISHFEESVSKTDDDRERQAAEQQVGMMKAQLSSLEKRRQELTTDEALLSQQLSAEQNRWADFNERLEQLDRSLAQK